MSSRRRSRNDIDSVNNSKGLMLMHSKKLEDVAYNVFKKDRNSWHIHFHLKKVDCPPGALLAGTICDEGEYRKLRKLHVYAHFLCKEQLEDADELYDSLQKDFLKAHGKNAPNGKYGYKKNWSNIKDAYDDSFLLNICVMFVYLEN